MPAYTSRSKSRSNSKHNRRQPLGDEILDPDRSSRKKRKSTHDSGLDDGDVARPTTLDARSSRKILKIGRELVSEDVEEEEESRRGREGGHGNFALESRVHSFAAMDDDDEEDEEGGSARLAKRTYEHDEDAWGSEEEEALKNGDMDISPQDLALFNKFNPDAASLSIQQDILSDEIPNEAEGESTNLADLILQKIAAHESQLQDQDEMPDMEVETGQPRVQGGGTMEDAVELPAKVVEVYTKIGLLLSRYKSGALPKPFKILPTLPSWPLLLSITRPESWSTNACFEATRIFISHKPHIAQEFLETVILDRVRSEIHETKKLNIHLYNSLKKSLYKPSAFFKGFLFPLVADGACTLREAHIISSVLVKVSIPVLHSAAALLRLTEIAAAQTSAANTESAGATNIFIRVLLDKKYALPYKVIDGLVFHFLRYRPTPTDPNSSTPNTNLASTEHKLPVLWHQSLLSFAQRYRNDITEDQREALLDLLLVRGHKDIGPEVRRELLAGRGRGNNPDGTDTGMQVREGGDDTMSMSMNMPVPVPMPMPMPTTMNGGMGMGMVIDV